MQNFTEIIERVDLNETNTDIFKRKFACALVLTKDLRILLQMRSADRKCFPGHLTTFGGGIEKGEEPMEALIRELNEELGACVKESEVISFGAIVEAVTNYTELVYVYFWHDHFGTITGCYEDLPLYFDDIEKIRIHPKVMDYVTWLLEQCINSGLFAPMEFTNLVVK